ncbi:hypothetical protein ACVW07_002989 [Cellulomonas sp. URHB0016]
MRTVVVGDDEAGLVEVGDEQLDRVGLGGDGEHRSGVVPHGGEDRLGAGPADGHEVGGGQRPGGGERHDLPVAVTGEQVGAHPCPLEEPVGEQVDDPQRRLGVLRAGERGLPLTPGLLVEGTTGVHDGGERRVDGKVLHDVGELREQRAEHPGALAALPGEEHGDPRRRPAGPDERPGVGRRPLGHRGQRAAQRRDVRDDQRDLHRPSRRERGDGPRRVAQVVARVLGVERDERRGRGGTGVGSADEDELRSAGAARAGGRHLPDVLAHDRVEVGPAEPERADGGAPGAVAEPRCGLGAEREAGGELRVDRRVDPHRGREHPGVQGEGRLDEPREPRGALGVADLRLDGAERPDPAVDGRVGGGGRRELGSVADGRARAVRLDEVDVGRVHPRPLQGPAHRRDLAAGPGRGQPLGPPVAAGPHGLDDAVDAVPVALGVLAPLEDDAHHALAEHDAVGGPVERAAGAGAGERVERREHHEVAHGVVQVDATGQGDVAGTPPQVVAREAERCQGGRAGGVDDEVRSPEVQAVGDAAGDDVRQHPGEGVARHGGQQLRDPVGEPAVQRRQVRADAERAGEVAPRLGAEDHRGPLAVRVLVGQPGVVERPPADLQREHLRGVDVTEARGRDAERHGVDGHRGEEAADGSVGRGHPIGGGVVVDPPVPPLGGHRPDGVAAVEHGGPVGVEVGRPGEHAGDADHGDLHGPGRACVGGRGDVPQLLDTSPEVGHGPDGEPLVELGERERLVLQGDDLPRHEHPFALPPPGGHGNRVRAVALDPLRRDAQPPDVELLEPCADLPPVEPVALELLAHPRELVDVRARRAAARVAGGGLQHTRAVGGEEVLLERPGDRAALDGLPREGVGGADEHPDRDTGRRERCGHRGHHRRAPGRRDAAREQHAQRLGRRLRGQCREVLQQHGRLHLPQGEPVRRADVAAALGPLEDEPGGPLPQELAQQHRRGHVQERRQAARGELRGLRRASTGEDRERRAPRGERADLLSPHLVGQEAEQPDAPRARTEQVGGAPDHVGDLRPGHHRERDRGERTRLGDGLGEGRHVADPRHRALHQGQPRAEGPRGW